MAILTIHADETLKKQVESLVSERRFSLEDGVSAFLSEIVRTRSLPIDLHLDLIPRAAAEAPRTAEPAVPAPASEKVETVPAAQSGGWNDADDWEDLPAPAILTKPGVDAFVSIICSIPFGKLSSWTDLEKKLTASYGFEVTKPLRDAWPKLTADGLAIPYWRVLSDRGAVKADITCSRELREAMLRAEGHEFADSPRGRGSVRTVKNYKEKTVRFGG